MRFLATALMLPQLLLPKSAALTTSAAGAKAVVKTSTG
eukprot:SAG11_NODE_33428_length_277_cov_0.870787_1_plen_37_part_10